VPLVTVDTTGALDEDVDLGRLARELHALQAKARRIASELDNLNRQISALPL
jgi:hypothetical protein